ncbi:MAG: VCBS repeat-containing protein [Planctomycetales bacterium]|nr:VCBS repeat-containing protein [Planctomycetales bacterium]
MQVDPNHDPQSVADEEFLEERDDEVIALAFRRSLIGLVAFLALAGIGVWYLLPKATPDVLQETQLEQVKVREMPQMQPPTCIFTDVTSAAGIDFVHQNGAYGDKLLPETMGGGGGFFDYDNDGDQDILFVNSQRWPTDPREATEPATLVLYNNNGQGQFNDVTTGSGLDISIYGMGVAFGDYDNDGLVDVFVTTVGHNLLFHNDGEGNSLKCRLRPAFRVRNRTGAVVAAGSILIVTATWICMSATMLNGRPLSTWGRTSDLPVENGPMAGLKLSPALCPTCIAMRATENSVTSANPLAFKFATRRPTYRWVSRSP